MTSGNIDENRELELVETLIYKVMIINSTPLKTSCETCVFPLLKMNRNRIFQTSYLDCTNYEKQDSTIDQIPVFKRIVRVAFTV